MKFNQNTFMKTIELKSVVKGAFSLVAYFVLMFIIFSNF